MGEDASATVTIAARPGDVFALVSDLARTGEWSPECVSVEWLGGATGAAPGARFRGHNRSGKREWTMEGVVDEVDAPNAFAFHTERNGATRTRWGYRLAATADGGTALTEWYERVAKLPLVARLVERFVLGDRRTHNEENMQASLGRIKEILEAS